MLQTEKLIILFQRKFRNKYKKYPYSLNNVKESKWYSHFSNFALTTRLESGDEEKFLDRLFDTQDEVVWPFVLSQKKAKQIEKNILDEKTYFKEEKLSEEDYIRETLKNCKVWCKDRKIEKEQLRSFILDPANQLMAERGRFYLPIFLFSRSFLNRHELTEGDILKKSSIRAFHVKVYETLRASLKDDFID